MTGTKPTVQGDIEVITVIERIPLKTEFACHAGALAAGHAYDERARANAHAAAGHAGHAAFFFEPGADDGGTLCLVYPWIGRKNLEQLLASEKAILDEWFSTYAAGPRQVFALDEIPVDVEDSQ